MFIEIKYTGLQILSCSPNSSDMHISNLYIIYKKTQTKHEIRNLKLFLNIDLAENSWLLVWFCLLLGFVRLMGPSVITE